MPCNTKHLILMIVINVLYRPKEKKKKVSIQIRNFTEFKANKLFYQVSNHILFSVKDQY